MWNRDSNKSNPAFILRYEVCDEMLKFYFGDGRSFCYNLLTVRAVLIPSNWLKQVNVIVSNERTKKRRPLFVRAFFFRSPLFVRRLIIVSDGVVVVAVAVVVVDVLFYFQFVLSLPHNVNSM